MENFGGMGQIGLEKYRLKKCCFEKNGIKDVKTFYKNYVQSIYYSRIITLDLSPSRICPAGAQKCNSATYLLENNFDLIHLLNFDKIKTKKIMLQIFLRKLW